MKIFKTKDYPYFLTDENIEALINMKNLFPPLKEWLEIKKILSAEEQDFIRRKEKVKKRKKIREKFLNSLTEDEIKLLNKKIIRPEDFPIEMNMINTEILTNMFTANILEQWRNICDLLTYEQKKIIWDRDSERQEEKSKQRWDELTKEELELEKRKREISLQEDPKIFKGNILQQELDSIELEIQEREKNMRSN